MKKRITSRKFGKSPAHRKAMMSNMASSLIEHKRIKTTHQKALELRKFIEPMITKAKDQSLHNRREVMKKIHNSDAVKTLFDVIAPVYSDRPGGYTRIIKLGTRTNDAAVAPAEPQQQEEDSTIALVRIVSCEEHDLESPAAPLKPGVTSSLERMEVMMVNM